MKSVVKIGENLKRYRTLEALTQVELAGKAGITETTLARIERNESEPHMTTIRKLAVALDVRPRDLVGGF